MFKALIKPFEHRRKEIVDKHHGVMKDDNLTKQEKYDVGMVNLGALLELEETISIIKVLADKEES